MEEQADQMVSIANDACEHSSKHGAGLQRETYSAELGIRKPLWFRLLLRIPDLPSTLYMPAIAGLLCYLFLPSLIIGAYLLAFLYIALTVPFPWVYLCLAGIVLPSAIVSLSAKAHAFWNHWQCLISRNDRPKASFEQSIEDYVALVKREEP